MPLTDYAGCIHVHSTASDGDVAPEAIFAAAREAGLHVLVLTDHPPLPEAYAELAGWHDGLLVALAPELKAAGQHCLALGLTDGQIEELREEETVEAGLERVQRLRRGGTCVFVAHPKTVAKPLFHVGPPGWHDWSVDAFDGIEIWPYMHDWICDLGLRNFLSHLREPDRWITGPHPDVLKHWDQVGRQRHCPGIGALDNHARRLPFRRWGPALVEIFPHLETFRTVRTHLLADQPFSGDATADLATVGELLARGRCYVSYDLLADATGFIFAGEQGEARLQMGDEVAADAPVQLRAQCPVGADLRLVRNGKPIAETHGKELTQRVEEPGVYRVEVHLDGRPWLFSNPIYLRERPVSPRPPARAAPSTET
jgi:hypothetical protein